MWKLHIIWTVNSREWYCGLDPLSRFLLVTLRRRAVAPISPEGDPCCCPTCVVGAFIGPPAPTPRPTIKHGTHVVKRNRNRYCYRSHGRYGTLEQFARRRDTIHLVSYALFRGPIFHAARPRGACNADRFSSDRSRNRMVPWARMKCIRGADVIEGEKKEKNPQLRRTVFLFKRSESEGREGE